MVAPSPTRVASPHIVRTDSPLRRTVDVIIALSALVVLAPVLAIMAALVLVTSGRPAFFRQIRVGKDGREFAIIKFRTMRHAAATAPLVTGAHDARITAIGRLLRKSHMDELPQLINLVRGDLTLIGPRPEVPRYVAAYTEREQELLRVRPGLVGPGALLFASQARELDDCPDPEAHYLASQMHPRLALDLEYLEHRTIGRDLSLAWRAALTCIGYE